jgi:hypothetical protein
MPQSAASTPSTGCHFFSSGGISALSCCRYHRFSKRSRCSADVPGRTRTSILAWPCSTTVGAASLSMTRSRYQSVRDGHKAERKNRASAALTTPRRSQFNGSARVGPPLACAHVRGFRCRITATIPSSWVLFPSQDRSTSEPSLTLSAQPNVIQERVGDLLHWTFGSLQLRAFDPQGAGIALRSIGTPFRHSNPWSIKIAGRGIADPNSEREMTGSTVTPTSAKASINHP